jgi:hypothetical protein
MCRSLLCVLAGMLALLSLSLPTTAQRTSGYASQQAAVVPADFTEGNLKFHRASSFMQVTDTTNNQSAGTVIFPPGSAPVFAPMPGYDIKAAYEKHMNSASAPPETGNAATQNPPTSAPSPTAAASGFDAAIKTATLSDGRSVTFIDNDNADVILPGPVGTQTYHLNYHGNSGMSFARSLASANRGGVGESMGTGVIITVAAANGMPGGQLYDTSVGSNVPASVISRVKPIVDAVADAVRLANPTDPNLEKTKVIHSILHTNIYRAPGY